MIKRDARKAGNRTRRAGVALVAVMAGVLLGGGGVAQAKDTSAPLFGLLPPEVQERGVIRVAGDAYPPYRIIAEDGKTRTGLEADLLGAMAPLLGVEFENTVVAALPAMLAGIDTGRYDLSTGPLLDTPKREERYDIIPWIYSKPSYLLLASAGDKVSTLEDICGMRVAYSPGSASERYQHAISERCEADGRPRLQDVPLQDKSTLMLAVRSNRADAMSSEMAAALYLQSVFPGEFILQTDQTDALGVLHLGFVLPKGSPLSPAILAALKAMQENGDYQAVMTEWGLGAAAQQEFHLNPASMK